MADLEAVGEEVGQHPGTVLLSHAPRAAAGGRPEEAVGAGAGNREDVETVVEGLDENLELAVAVEVALATKPGEICGLMFLMFIVRDKMKPRIWEYDN